MANRLILVLSVVALSVGIAVGCAGKSGGAGSASASEAIVASPFATCSFFFRDERGEEQKTTLTVARGEEGEDRKASTTLGDFRVLVTEGSEHPHVAGTVTVWVGSKTAAADDWFGHTLYQLGPQNRSLSHELSGGHGFTGLHYVRHPQTGSELQWLCAKAAAAK